MVLKETGVTIVIVNYIFLGLSTVTFALRCYVRISRVAFGLDDWLLLVGWLMFIVNVAMSTMASIHGLGQHNPTMTAAEMEPAVKVSLFSLTFTLQYDMAS